MGIKERWNRYSSLPANILDRIENLGPLFQERGVLLAYLFGSLAKNKSGNDADIALLYEGDSVNIRNDLQKAIESWRLDIVNLKTAPLWLKFEIIRNGRIIFRRDADIENIFEMNVIKQYQDMKPWRDKQSASLKENLMLVYRGDSIVERLKELDTIVEELTKYSHITKGEMEASLSKRWIIERGMIAGANMIFDVADHILSSRFHIYPETYEDSLRFLNENKVITEALYEDIAGLGGFRNILVHDYLDIDFNEEHQNFLKAMKVFRAFAKEILLYMEKDVS